MDCSSIFIADLERVNTGWVRIWLKVTLEWHHVYICIAIVDCFNEHSQKFVGVLWHFTLFTLVTSKEAHIEVTQNIVTANRVEGLYYKTKKERWFEVTWLPWYWGKRGVALFEVTPKEVTMPSPTSRLITKELLVCLP